MSDKPEKIEFKRAEPKREAPLRDKDNANPQPKPKLQGLQPAGNKGPMGTKGIQEGLPRRSTPEKKPRFSLGEGGDLKKTFKPIAKPTRDKGPSHDL